MTNITNLIVTNITVRSCLGNQYNNATVLIKQCTNVQLRHVVIEENHNSYGIVGINVLGDSRFSHLKSNSLKISFRELIVDEEKHNVTIDHCHISDDHMEYKIELNFLQIAYSVKVTILQSSFQWLRNSWSIIHAFFEHEATGLLMIKQCQFANNDMNLVNIKQPMVYGVLHDFIYIEDSLFVNNSFSFTGPIESQFIRISRNFNVYITNCTFHNNSNGITIHKRTHLYLGLHLKVFVISNTTFSSSSTHNDVVLIRLVSVDLHLKGPVIFNNISGFSSIILLIKSKITCSNYIEISTSNSTAIINYETDKTNFVILVMEHTTMNITHNNFKKFSDILIDALQVYKYPPCFFQYLKDPDQVGGVNYTSYSILFEDNTELSGQFAYNNLPLTHCFWLPQSAAFNTTIPLVVNRQIIKYNNTFYSLPQSVSRKRMCYCDTNTSYDCYRDTIDPVYSGQTTTLHLYMDITSFDHSDVTVTVIKDSEILQPTACSVLSNTVQTATRHTCNALNYSIYFLNTAWCELFLKVSSDGIEKMEIFI